MKIIIASNGKKTVKISKSEWLSIGEEAGWTKTATQMTIYDKDQSKAIDPDKAYEKFRTSYEKSTGKSWEKDKFMGRAKGWIFFGDDNGYVAVRQQRSGPYKLTGVAGSMKSVYKGFQELMAEGKPVWGMVSPELSSMGVKMGMKALHGYKWGLLLKSLLPYIPKGVFGGVDYSVNMKGEITLKYDDVGDATKIFIANDKYFEWLKININSNPRIPASAKAVLSSLIPGVSAPVQNKQIDTGKGEIIDVTPVPQNQKLLDSPKDQAI